MNIGNLMMIWAAVAMFGYLLVNAGWSLQGWDGKFLAGKLFVYGGFVMVSVATIAIITLAY